MSAIRKTLPLLVLVFLAVLSARAATWTTIDAPGGSKGTLILAINNKEDMTGIYFDDVDVSHAFLLSDGNFLPIDVPGAVYVFPTGINDLKQITGLFETVDQLTHGFFIDGSNVTVLDFPGAFTTHATGINNAAEIVGFYDVGDDRHHGFKWSNGNYIAIDSVGNPSSITGINNSGDILGYRRKGKRVRSFIINRKGAVRRIAHTMTGLGLNDKRIVVGYSTSVRHGSRFNTNTKIYTKIYAPNSTRTACFGINNAGEIVGFYIGVNDALDHGFLRTK
jgi:probable HAF family extracellular repeat protein